MNSARPGPSHIERLSQDVINRIAAGEVVQRPSAAVKEMIENSLDAGATRIQVICQDGGLSSLQITDDGCGIYREDLPLLCERFATSKLRQFEDLREVASFGFRGEALASISHVAKVTVTTMRYGDPHAWQAVFCEGSMVGQPTVVAGNVGTTIRVDDMFYNAPVRQSTLGKPTEEFSRVLDVVQKYSLCFPHVAMSCRNANTGAPPGSASYGAGGAAKFDYASAKGSTTLTNIKAVFGSDVASHLLPIQNSATIPAEPIMERTASPHSASPPCVTLSGFCSDATLVNKKSQLVLFVNKRLVDHSGLRKCIQQIYASQLTGTNKSVVVLFVEAPAHRVDVNVHPTKSEVMLLDEDLVLRLFSESARAAIAKSNASKQLLLGVNDSRLMGLKHSQVPLTMTATQPTPAAALGIRAVVAPCTMTRVVEQRGDILKWVVKVDPYAAVTPTTTSEPKGNADPTVPTHSDSRNHHVVVLEDDTDAAAGGTEGVAHSSQAVDDNPVAVEIGKGTTLLSNLGSARNDAAVMFPISLRDSSDSLLPDDIPVALTVPAVESCEENHNNDDEEEPLRVFKEAFLASRAADTGHQSTAAVGVDNSATTGARRGDATGGVAVGTKCGDGTESGASTSSVDVQGTADGCASKSTAHALPSSSIPAAEAPSLVRLTSVQNIVDAIVAQSPEEARHVFSKLVYVGGVDSLRCFAQSGTTLFSVDVRRLAKEVAFQRVFFGFGRHLQMAFVDGTAPRVRSLLQFALEHDVVAQLTAANVGDSQPSNCTSRHRSKRCSRGDAESVASNGSGVAAAVDRELNIHGRLSTLRRWRRMYEEYFCIELKTIRSADGTLDMVLQKLPLLLGEAWPCPFRSVPMLLWRLSDVSYDCEESALLSIANILAEELCGRELHIDSAAERQRVDSGRSSLLYDAIRFGLFPAVTNSAKFYPSIEMMTDHTLTPVVTVEALYKVFERC